MVRRLTPVFMVFALALSGCGGSKKEVVETPPFELNECPVARLEISPSRVDDPSNVIGSDRETSFSASAYDREGRPIERDLTWSFVYPDGDDGTRGGAGHSIIVESGGRATFRAGGLAAGTFNVMVQDRGCNLYTDEEPQYAEAIARVKVYSRPGDPAACGKMRVTYGDELDRMGDELIASAKVTLISEISAREKLPSSYKVRFFFKDEAFPKKRPLYRDDSVVRIEGMPMGYKSILPIYLVPGQYEVHYELLDGDDVVCGSRAERFETR